MTIIKKTFLIAVLIVISSCAGIETNISQLKYNEVLGVGYESYDGKLFQISCRGNSDASEDYVRQECLRETSQLVHSKGYKYFSVLSQDGNMKTKTEGIFMGNALYSSTSKYYNKNIVITVLKEDELQKFNNFYKVADYYTPTNG